MCVRGERWARATLTVCCTDRAPLLSQPEHFWWNWQGVFVVTRSPGPRLNAYVQFNRISSSRRSCLMFWKNGIEYRGVDPVGGDRTRWDVARASPQVTISKPECRRAEFQAADAHQNGTNALTFTDIDNECSRNGWHLNPFARKVLDLEPFVR